MRLFAAIGLSPAAEDALVYAQDILRRAGRGSFPRREMLHLTLAFLGETADAAAAEAAVEALRHCDDEIEAMVVQYDMRRRLLVDSLNQMGLSCFSPEGAFYVFPSIQSTGLTSGQFCEQLLYSQKVAVVPGNAFGESGEGFVRISYSYSVDHLLEALRRIQAFLEQHKAQN